MPSTTTSLLAPTAAAPRFRLRPIHGLLVTLAVLLFALYWGAIPPLLVRPLFPFVVVAVFFNPFFESLTGLAIAVVAAVGVAALGFRHAAGRPRLRALFVGGALLALLFPALMPTLYGSYELHVEAMPGHELHWLTPPATPWHSALKEAHRDMEIVGCGYFLEGWGEDNALYFRDTCTAGYWRFDPAQDSTVQPSAALPPIATSTQKGPYSPERQGRGPYPTALTTLHSVGRGHFITYERAHSPDGLWDAAAIANIYGPRDVVVVSR